MTKNNLQDVYTNNAVFATYSLNAVDVTFVLKNFNLLNDTFLTGVILLCQGCLMVWKDCIG